MAISASDVMRLREMTGVGMMDCKKALNEANGDFDRAVEILRTKGQATAAKRAGKTAAEGKVLAKAEGGVGVAVEVNCETDFVARNPEFESLVEAVGALIATRGPADLAALSALEIPGTGKTVDARVKELTGTIGEKLVVRRFERIVPKAPGFVQEYVHMGGRIGVLVAVSGDDGTNDEVRALARDVAMQAAAMRPSWLDPESVPAAELDKEREIQKQRALEEGKPENMVAKIAEGRLKKFFSEVCLLDQPFVKEQKKAVREIVAEVGKKVGKTLKVTAFARYEVGEGIQAAKED